MYICIFNLWAFMPEINILYLISYINRAIQQTYKLSKYNIYSEQMIQKG